MRPRLTLLFLAAVLTLSLVASEAQVAQPLVNQGSGLNRGLTNWWLVMPGWRGGPTLRNLLYPRHGTLTAMAIPSTTSSGWQMATSRQGGFGQLQCDGSDDYVAMPTTTTFNQAQGSVAVWLNPTATTTGTRPWTDANGGYVYMEFSAANTLNFIIFSAAPGTLDSGGFTITTNAWQHVVATWSPAGIFAYVNGKLAASNTSGTGVLNSSATLPMELCADHNFSTWYGGAIDDVRMWQRALPAREVWQVYLDSLQGYPATLSRTLSTPNVSVAPPSARKRIYVY